MACSSEQEHIQSPGHRGQSCGGGSSGPVDAQVRCPVKSVGRGGIREGFLEERAAELKLDRQEEHSRGGGIRNTFPASRAPPHPHHIHLKPGVVPPWPQLSPGGASHAVTGAWRGTPREHASLDAERVSDLPKVKCS